MAANLQSIDQTASSMRQTEAGIAFTRVATVTGVTGSGPAQFINALAVAGIPRMGEMLPGWATARVTARKPIPKAEGTFQIDIEYTDTGVTDDPEEQTIRIGTSLQSVETNVDVNGNLMMVEYRGQSQAKTITLPQPHSTIVVSRTETENPGRESREYVGKVNTQGGFNLAGANEPERSWRCNRIEGTSTDKGRTWAVEREFEYAEPVQDYWDEQRPGWDETLVYTDPETGLVPDDVADGTAREEMVNAIQNFQVRKEKNFNDLHLT